MFNEIQVQHTYRHILDNSFVTNRLVRFPCY